MVGGYYLLLNLLTWKPSRSSLVTSLKTVGVQRHHEEVFDTNFGPKPPDGC